MANPELKDIKHLQNLVHFYLTAPGIYNAEMFTLFQVIYVL